MPELYLGWGAELRKVLAFIQEENRYLILFFLTILMYFSFFASAAIVPPQEISEIDSNPAFRTLEETIEKRIQDPVYWENTIKERPGVVTLMVGGFIVIVLVLGIGIVTDIVWLTNRFRGKPLHDRKTAAPPEVTWPLQDLFRVPMLFISLSMILAIVVLQVSVHFIREEHSHYLLLSHTLLTDIGIAFCVIYFVCSVHGQSAKALGLDFSHWLRDITVGFSTYCSILPAFLLLLLALVVGADWLGYKPPPHPLVEVLSESRQDGHSTVIFSFVLASLVGPVIEEIFFRGFCYPLLRRHWGVFWSLVVTSAVFAAVHQSGFAFLPVFVLGMILAYLYERRRSLLPSIVLHITHNTLFLGYFMILKTALVDG